MQVTNLLNNVVERLGHSGPPILAGLLYCSVELEAFFDFDFSRILFSFLSDAHPANVDIEPHSANILRKDAQSSVGKSP